jgi:hypothetical protein
MIDQLRKLLKLTEIKKKITSFRQGLSSVHWGSVRGNLTEGAPASWRGQILHFVLGSVYSYPSRKRISIFFSAPRDLLFLQKWLLVSLDLVHLRYDCLLQ